MKAVEIRHRILASNVRLIRRPADGDHGPYMPIDLQALMGGERVTFGLYVKVAETEGGHTKLIPYLEEGAVLEPCWLEKLRKLGVKKLFFLKQDLEKAIAYLNNHLLVESRDKGATAKELCILREHLAFSLYAALSAPRLGQHVGLAKKPLAKLLKLLQNDRRSWNFLLDILYRDYTLYYHSVNVAILAMSMGVFLRKSRKECLQLGWAGLFHDVGLTAISEALTNKREPLTPEEWETLKKHPCLGYRLLKGNAEVPVASLRLILEHHENADGSGYPQGLALTRQHPLTRVLALVEAYDGLTIYRPYRPEHTPFAALKILQEERGAKGGMAFDPVTLKKFIEFLALR